MTQVIVDEVLRQKLLNLSQPLELCDDAGHVLARLVPALDPAQFEPVEPHLSAEELERRRQEPDYSTAEVLDYLRRL